MAKRKVNVEVKAEELNVATQEEPVAADVMNEKEPVNIEVAEEQNGLLDGEADEEDKENCSVSTTGKENQQEDISAEIAGFDSVEPVDVEVNMEDVSTGAEEELQDSNESLPESIEDKEVIPVTFRSDSEEARHYILEFLKDGESHKKSEVVAYITERAGKSFTEATVINVLRGMINSGSIISLERGCYSIGSGSGLLSKLVQFIEVTRCQLEKVATISVSDIKEEDYKAISELKSLKENLNAMYERLTDN